MFQGLRFSLRTSAFPAVGFPVPPTGQSIDQPAVKLLRNLHFFVQEQENFELMHSQDRMFLYAER